MENTAIWTNRSCAYQIDSMTYFSFFLQKVLAAYLSAVESADRKTKKVNEEGNHNQRQRIP